MLHAGLLILKILGIILLIVPGLLLLFLCAVLFAAVSYRVRAKREETFEVSASAAWLFRIVSLSASFAEGSEQGIVLRVRLFGFPLFRMPEEEKPAKAKRRPAFLRLFKRRKRRKRKPEGRKAAADKAAKEDTGSVKETMPERREEPTPAAVPEHPPAAPVLQKEKKDRKRPFFAGIFRKAACAVRRIRAKIKQIWKKLLGVKDVVRRLLDRKEALLQFWNLEEHRNARGALWKEARYLWRKSRPKKIKGRIRFGCSDPAHTGLCMGAAGMMCAWYPRRLELVPDFEQKILKGELDIRGRIRCYVFVRILLRIYFHKDIRRMYERWKEL